jgi:hypothetical protein
MRFALRIHSFKGLVRSSKVCAVLLISAAAGCALKGQSTPMAASVNRVIVRLVSRDGVITITTGPIVPLYTMADASGRVLVSGVTMSDLKRARPDLYEQIYPLVSSDAEIWAGGLPGPY